MFSSSNFSSLAPLPLVYPFLSFFSPPPPSSSSRRFVRVVWVTCVPGHLLRANLQRVRRYCVSDARLFRFFFFFFFSLLFLSPSNPWLRDSRRCSHSVCRPTIAFIPTGNAVPIFLAVFSFLASPVSSTFDGGIRGFNPPPLRLCIDQFAKHLLVKLSLSCVKLGLRYVAALLFEFSHRRGKGLSKSSVR